MDPVPWEVKLVFHIFGLVTFISGLVTVGYTAQAGYCRISTNELYYYSIAACVLILLSTVYFVFLIPFWIAERFKPDIILDRKQRVGCFEISATSMLAKLIQAAYICTKLIPDLTNAIGAHRIHIAEYMPKLSGPRGTTGPGVK
ncbi:DgyrCDS3813 [Dimorphilus gyrociliatus]|uniref:DgyrCDS3813 n=1 Tax=Dimorphilus gyrociliatus TaxID=2664684 RepID=A0A7I8VJM5_9ANNE|nr:DgyrCDS3813 [Dimorphilus gyrociliatus]